MGKLSRGITYQPNERITTAKLYALIDTAIASGDAFPGMPSIYDIVMGDLATGARAIHSAASPSAPATNDLAVGSDGKLDRYTGSVFVDLSTDTLFMINGHFQTLVTGNPIIVDVTTPGNCVIYSQAGPCPHPLGLSAGVYGPGVTASIRVHGLALARVNSPLSVSVGDHLRIGALGATALSSTTSVATDVLAVVVQTDVDAPLSGMVLAMLVH